MCYNIIMDKKRCYLCGEEKAIMEFRREPKNKDGFGAYCKKCRWKRHSKGYRLCKKEIAADSQRRKRKIWASKHPGQWNIYQMVHRAIERGEIEKPGQCSNCGITGVLIEGHHYDYSKPFDLTWLCHACHQGLRQVSRHTV